MAVEASQDPVSQQLLQLSELIQTSIARLVEIRQGKTRIVDSAVSTDANASGDANGHVNGETNGNVAADTNGDANTDTNGKVNGHETTNENPKKQPPQTLTDRELFDHQRTLLAAAGTLTELVSEPQNRLLEVSSQYFEARALHIAADARIPNILAKHGDSGLAVETLAAEVGIESRKLCKSANFTVHTLSSSVANYYQPARVLRCLCSIHVFREVGPDVFANNDVSASLVDNEPLRAYIMLL